MTGSSRPSNASLQRRLTRSRQLPLLLMVLLVVLAACGQEPRPNSSFAGGESSEDAADGPLECQEGDLVAKYSQLAGLDEVGGSDTADEALDTFFDEDPVLEDLSAKDWEKEAEEKADKNKTAKVKFKLQKDDKVKGLAVVEQVGDSWVLTGLDMCQSTINESQTP